MKTNFKAMRIFALLLISVMMLSAFAACAETNDPATTTANPEASNAPSGEGSSDQTSTAPAETSDPTLDKNGYLKDNLPELNYNGHVINLLVWDDVEHEEFEVAAEDLSGDFVEQSLYDRNETVKKRLNVDLNFIRIDGDSENNQAWNDYVNNSVSVNSREFDILGGYSLSMAQCAKNGYLYNLLDDECEYLDFDMPWWSKLLLEQATFGDNLYFASGDISRNALEMMYVCYANTSLLEEYQLVNPQELVEPGDWTYAKFFEMCQGVYKDDGDGIKNCEA